jgi:hypothetical protein
MIQHSPPGEVATLLFFGALMGMFIFYVGYLTGRKSLETLVQEMAREVDRAWKLYEDLPDAEDPHPGHDAQGCSLCARKAAREKAQRTDS